MGSKKFRNRDHEPPGRSFVDILRESEGKNYKRVFDDYPPKKETATQMMLRRSFAEDEFQKALMKLLHDFRDALEDSDRQRAMLVERELNRMGFGVEADLSTSELVLTQIKGAREVDKAAWLRSIMQEPTPRPEFHPEYPVDPETRAEAQRRMQEFYRRNPYEDPWSTPRPFKAEAAKEEPIEPPKLKVPGLEQSLEFLANDFLDELEGDSK